MVTFNYAPTPTTFLEPRKGLGPAIESVKVRAGLVADGGYKQSHQDVFYLDAKIKELTAKYNQLLRIEQELGDNAIYAGRDVVK